MNFNLTNSNVATATTGGVCAQGTVAAGAAVEDTMSSEGWDG